MIQIDGLKKAYGGEELFTNLDFKINARERIGLVGRNGHGKSTILAIIAGIIKADQGNIYIPKNYRIAYLRQNLNFSAPSVMEEVSQSLPGEEKDALWKVEKVLAGLGFSDKEMLLSPLIFSGGFQIRVHLAKILVSEPDLLLLDEPSNYLDISSIRWLQSFLSSWPRELVLVTHDRSFMDKVVTHIIGIHRKTARKVLGDTDKYYRQLAQEEEIYEKTRINDEKKRKETELFIRRFRAKARLAAMVQSRIKALNKAEKYEKLEDIKNLDFVFPYQPYKGKYMLHAEDLEFYYDREKSLIKDLSFSLGEGECLCIIGKNGRGKTTLLKLLAGSLETVSGSVRYSPGVEAGIYEQSNISTLNPERSVEEEIMAADPACELQFVRNICGFMMFEGDKALKPVSVLSGGEKSRVMLGRLLVKKHNLLFLDEPTNHLDMDTCDALLEAVANFQGAVVMVTHNEMFLHALADRLIVFGDKGPKLFYGSYQDFLEKEGWDEELSPSRIENISSLKEGEEKNTNKKHLRKLRSEIIQRRSTALKPLEEKIRSIETGIETLEESLNKLSLEMQEFSLKGDGLKLSEISKKIAEVQESIDLLYEDFEEKILLHEGMKEDFDKEILLLEESFT